MMKRIRDEGHMTCPAFWLGLQCPGLVIFCQRPGRERSGRQPKRSGSPAGGQALCALEGVCPGGPTYPPRPGPTGGDAGGLGQHPLKGLPPPACPQWPPAPPQPDWSSPTVPSRPGDPQSSLLFMPLTWSSRLNLVQRTLTSPSGQHNGSEGQSTRPLQPAKPPKGRKAAGSSEEA